MHEFFLRIFHIVSQRGQRQIMFNVFVDGSWNTGDKSYNFDEGMQCIMLLIFIVKNLSEHAESL